MKSGTIRIIDLAFVLKDADGNMTGIELEDVGSDVFQAFESLTAERGGFVSEEDLHAVAGELEPNSSAAILVWEDVWATKLTEAIVGAGGRWSTFSACRASSSRKPLTGPRKTAPPPAPPHSTVERSSH